MGNVGEFLASWKCHKTVRAGRIKEIVRRTVAGSTGDITIVHLVVERGEGDETVARAFAPESQIFARYFPVIGDYYVVYQDGYESISPKEQFEDGYSKIAIRP